MRNINWWLVLATALCLFSFGAFTLSALLGRWDCVLPSGIALLLSYLAGRWVEEASQ